MTNHLERLERGEAGTTMDLRYDFDWQRRRVDCLVIEALIDNGVLTDIITLPMSEVDLPF